MPSCWAQDAPGADGSVFPTQAQVRAWDAERLVAAARHWTPGTARQRLGDWLSERGGGGWPALLAALAATDPGPDAAGQRALFGLLDLATAPAPVLEALLTNSVLGGYAECALHERGRTPDASAVTATARALFLVDELEAVRSTAALTHRMTSPDQEEPEMSDEVHAAFDKAAADWPGGGPALFAALTVADPYASAFLAQQLSHHPDPATAEEARSAWRAYRTGRTAALTGHTRKAKPASRRKSPAAKRSGKKRKRG